MTTSNVVVAGWRWISYVLIALVAGPCGAVIGALVADAAVRGAPGGVAEADLGRAFVGPFVVATLAVGLAFARFARRGMVTRVDAEGVVARGLVLRRRLAFGELAEAWTVERRMPGIRIEHVYWYEGPRGRVRISELHQRNAGALVAAVEAGRRAAR